MRTKNTRLLLGISTLAMGCGTSLPLRAQTTPPAVPGQSTPPATTTQRPEVSDLNEIIVTAEYRTLGLQQSALSVTAISGDDIAQHGDSNISQVLQNVPGVQIQGIEGGMSALSVTGGGGPPNISIRGLGTDGPNKSSSTAVYEDGVLLLGGGGEFYDINRVEVLRGPQGTLYGRGATGGAVNIITKDPSQEWEEEARVQYGSDRYVGVQSVLNAPLGDSVSARLGVNAIQHGGYLSNGLDDERDINVRLKILYKPTDDLSLLVGGTYYRFNDQGAGTEVVSSQQPNADVWKTTLPGGSSETINYKKIHGTLEWHLGPAELTYIPALQTTDSVDGQFGGIGKEFTTAPFDRTVTQELRLSGLTQSRIAWSGGAYYYHNTNEQVFSTGPVAAVFVPPVIVTELPTQTSRAAFGELNYPITSALRATVGARETWDHIQATDTFNVFGGVTGDVFDKDYKHFDWKARLDGDLSPDNLVYGMVSTGYRPGGSVNGVGYTNEVVKAYEVGSKNRFDNAVTLNAAAFYYDYSGFQSPQSVTDPNNQAIFQSVIVSLPARIYGLDVELTAHVTPHDTITASPEFLRGHYGSNFTFTSPYDGSVSSIATSGGQLPHMPKFSISGSYVHTFDLPNGAGLMADADAHYQMRQLTDFDTSNYPSTNPIFNQDGYTIVNTFLTYVSPKESYSVTAYGKNLANEVYKLTTSASFGQNIAYVNDPRTYGVIVRVHF
jgi:iron complex outermembrane receptor protein